VSVLIRTGLGYIGNDKRSNDPRADASSGRRYRYTPFEIPTAQSIPGIVVVDNNDTVWFTEMGGGFVGPGFPPGPPGGKVGYVRNGQLGEISMPSADAGPTSMALDAGNNDIWVSLRAANKVARIRNDVVTEYDAPLPNSMPVGVAVDKNHNVWVAMSDGNALARLTPDGQWKVLPIPDAGAAPRTVIIDSSNQVWFAEKMGNHIGLVDREKWEVQRWKIPTRMAWPLSLIEDDKGNMWFAEMRADKLGMIDRNTKAITEYKLPPNSAPFKLFFDAKDKSMWISTVFGNSVMRFDLGKHAVSDNFPVPNDGVWIGGLDRDRNHCFWVTEQFGNRIDRLCIDGYSSERDNTNVTLLTGGAK
jgi:streptogramin lyase